MSETDKTAVVSVEDFPDLGSILDDVDFERKPLKHGNLDGGLFHVGKWGSLIIELVSYPDEVDNILANYNLTRVQYAKLMGNEIFRAVYNDTKSSIVALAGSGGYQLSARRLAEQGLSILEDIMENGKDSDRLKAIELSARLANLDPIIQAKTKEQASGSTGVQLVVNFGGGMPMPSSFNVKQNEQVIEVKPDEVEYE